MNSVCNLLLIQHPSFTGVKGNPINLMHVCLSTCLCGFRERCGVIKIRQAGPQRHWRERETLFQNGPGGPRRLTRKRYIDLGKEQLHTNTQNRGSLNSEL